MQCKPQIIASHAINYLCVCACVCACVCVTDIDQDPRAPGKENDLEFPKEDLQAGGLHTSLVTSKMTPLGLWVLSWSSALLQLGDSHPPSDVSQDSLATHPWSRRLTRRSEGRDRNMDKGIKKSNI